MQSVTAQERKRGSYTEQLGSHLCEAKERRGRKRRGGGGRVLWLSSLSIFSQDVITERRRRSRRRRRRRGASFLLPCKQAHHWTNIADCFFSSSVNVCKDAFARRRSKPPPPLSANSRQDRIIEDLVATAARPRWKQRLHLTEVRDKREAP